MADEKRYWPNELHSIAGHNAGFVLEARAELAWRLLTHFGLIAGVQSEDNDAAGRKYLELQQPEMVIRRCFEIADEFVNVAEARGLMRAPTVSLEDAFEAGGRLERVRNQASFGESQDILASRRERKAKELASEQP